MTSYLGLIDFKGTSAVQDDGRLVNEYVHTYLYRSDAATLLTPAEVTAAIGIAIGSPYSGDIKALCWKAQVGVGPVMTRPPFMAYTVVYEWSTNKTAAEDPTSTDPLDRRVVWSIRPNIQSRYIIRDRNQELITNTAGQPFASGVPVDVRFGTVIARKNVDATGFDKASVLADSGSVNSSPYLGGAEGTVQVDIEAEERYEGAYHFWAVTYVFSYDPDGWQPKAPSAGFFQREAAASNVLKRIINSDIGDPNNPDDPVQEPEPLDADGLLVPIGSRPDDCAFVEVDWFPAKNFADFDL